MGKSQPFSRPLHFTSHAKRRMRQRRITEEDVICALTNPIDHKPDQLQGSIRVQGLGLDGDVLRVWLVDHEEDGMIKVKTTAWKD